MELHHYLRIVRKRWPFVVIGFLLTTALTFVFVNRQPSIYESKATFVIRARTLNSADGVKAIDALTRGVEISSTFATVARSELIRERAEERMDSALNTSGLRVSSEVLTSTNILELTVSGSDPDAVHGLATAIGDETVDYIAALQQVFELQNLDAPKVPTNPVAPNRRLILATGMVFGVAIGAVFALLAEGLSRRPRPRQFERQLARALRTNQPFSTRYGNLTGNDEDSFTVAGVGNGHDPEETLNLREARSPAAPGGPPTPGPTG